MSSVKKQACEIEGFTFAALSRGFRPFADFRLDFGNCHEILCLNRSEKIGKETQSSIVER